jgi:hypothetical protein
MLLVSENILGGSVPAPPGRVGGRQLLHGAGRQQVDAGDHQPHLRPALRIECHPRRPGSADGPDQRHRQRHRPPAPGADRVDEADVGEHRRRQHEDRHQHDPWRRMNREDHQDEHVPAAGKTGERLVVGLHPRVGKVERRGKGYGDQRCPACPARHQPGGKEREGRDEDIGQVIDDQVQQRPVHLRRVGQHVVFPRQRPVDAVNGEGHDQPKEHHRPVVTDGREQGEHRQHRARGGQKMDGIGAVFRFHASFWVARIGRPLYFILAGMEWLRLGFSRPVRPAGARCGIFP